ncbi:hypothetical protein E2562_023824 [Oryza meyeriana var. granulata]|uniref:Uncharacterized protein n=1 Tax=Oryza meyeriana var. granulata TaxID=110450 RepID=A0A6G1D744_9ORYZ|nr:hypothetical protein E2562_023824 [Oryza meyeriana var. granulata]
MASFHADARVHMDYFASTHPVTINQDEIAQKNYEIGQDDEDAGSSLLGRRRLGGGDHPPRRVGGSGGRPA